jgi:anti-sigma regulatory factor (Ser/Thr protein kinase)
MVRIHVKPEDGGQLLHQLFVHTGSSEYLRGVLSFAREGVRRGEPVIAVLPSERIELLREPVAREALDIILLDMTLVGRNPARLISAFLELVKPYRGRRVRVVGEPIWPERSSAEIDEAIMHESLVNTALSDVAITGLCPYDAARLDPRVIAAAKAAHPFLGDGNAHVPNPDYHTNGKWPRAVRPLGDPPSHACRAAFGAADLGELRRTVHRCAEEAGLSEDLSSAVVLAVNEIATNSVRYAGGGTLFLWSSPSGLQCQVTDRGHIADPMIGRVRPRAGALGARGVWLANQLCDLVQIRPGAEGTTIRIAVSRDPGS